MQSVLYHPLKNLKGCFFPLPFYASTNEYNEGIHICGHNLYEGMSPGTAFGDRTLGRRKEILKGQKVGGGKWSGQECSHTHTHTETKQLTLDNQLESVSREC